MSLLLCRQESAANPYYVDFLGIHLHTSQELCYVIYQYPLLVLDGFVGEPLLTFLREELNQGFLALKLERWIKSGESRDEALLMILQECDYYTSPEINQYKQQIAGIRRMHAAEYHKLRADELFQLKQYGKAVKAYRELLETPKDSYVDDNFIGRIWNNVGSCYARMFQLQKSFEAYEQAYARYQDPQILEKLYQLTLLDDRLVLGDRLASLVEEKKEVWEQRITETRERASESESVHQLEDLFSKDSIKRQAGMSRQLRCWKQEYRSMV